MTQLIKYEHLQLTSSQTSKWGGQRRRHRSHNHRSKHAEWLPLYERNYQLQSSCAEHSNKAVNLFNIVRTKHGCKNSIYRAKLTSKDSQSPTCFNTSWVLKHAGDCVSLVFTFQCKKGWFDKLKAVILQVRNIYSHTCKINKNNKQTNNKYWARHVDFASTQCTSPHGILNTQLLARKEVPALE